VLQANGEPPEEERPPWHWVPLGAFATFLVWLPLSAFTERVVRHFMEAAEANGGHLMAAGVGLVAGHAGAFFAGSLAGGVLVGRLGAGAGRREAAMGGALAGLLAWLIAAAQGTPGGALVWGLLVVIIATIGAGGGALGGSLGLRWKRRSKPAG
jgi:MFS family permease